MKRYPSLFPLVELPDEVVLLRESAISFFTVERRSVDMLFLTHRDKSNEWGTMQRTRKKDIKEMPVWMEVLNNSAGSLWCCGGTTSIFSSPHEYKWLISIMNFYLTINKSEGTITALFCKSFQVLNYIGIF